MKILIIEDDLDMAGTITNFFKLNGHEAHHAENGAVGIQMAFGLLPDAIICDINIPVVDGYQVYNILSETTSTQSIPFLFLTAKTSLSDIRQGMNLGADDYITKPFDFDDLLNSVTKRVEKGERTRKAHDQKFHNLLNNSPYGTFVYQQNRFVIVNQNLAGTFGYSQVQMQTMSFKKLVSDNEQAMVMDALSDCLTHKKKEFSVEFTGTTRFGKQIKLHLKGGYALYHGNDCIVGTLINLSSNSYKIKDVSLSSSDLRELGKAIELFSSDYDVISKDLIKKLSGIFTEENNQEPSVPVELSSREQEVLSEICHGKNTNEIAESLFISDRTVEKHRAAIIQKTNSKNMIEAVIFAIKNKMVEI